MSPRPSPRARALRRRLLVTGLLVAGMLAALVFATAARTVPARAATTGQLRRQIAGGRARVSSLAGAVAAQSRRLRQLDAGIATIQRELNGLQSDLVAKRAQLLRLRAALEAAQVRLAHLIAKEKADEQVLAAQLIGSYEGGQPNLVSVVLESTGFTDLLERLDFATRVSRQDTQVTRIVRAARRAVAAQAIHLGALEQRQQTLTDTVLAERNRVARTRITLVTQQLAAARTRTVTEGHLAGARAQVATLSTQLSQLQAAQRAAAARAAAAAAAAQRAAAQRAAAQRAASTPTPSAASPAPTPAPAAPAPAPSSGHSSGGFSFPLPISGAGSPGSWSPDDGVDITAPGGTPLYAVCSGTVVLHGIGGFGPSAPVIHCDSPVGGYSYVYYGHAGPGNWTPIGAHVAQGQVISEVGYGDVGISTGPHLEIGFADASGNPIGPSSAGTMLALLHGSY